MKIKIFSKHSIRNYEPEGKSFCIRISSHELYPLKFENKYEEISSFSFDDVEFENDYSITEDEAFELLEFAKKAITSNADELIIHCDYGQRRSPAVGIAISEMFQGSDNGLRLLYPNYNRLVLSKLKNFKEI